MIYLNLLALIINLTFSYNLPSDYIEYQKFSLEEENSENDSLNIHIPDDEDDKISFHMVTSKSVNESEISRLNNFIIGTNYNIKSGLDFQIGYNVISDEDMDKNIFKKKHNFLSKGLKFSLKKNLIEDFLSIVGGITITYARYDTDSELHINTIDEGIGYIPDIGIVANILGMDALFIAGYNINDIKDEDGKQLVSGMCFSVGLEF